MSDKIQQKKISTEIRGGTTVKYISKPIPIPPKKSAKNK